MFPREALGRKTNITETPHDKRGNSISRYALTNPEITDMIERHEVAMELDSEKTPKDLNRHPELVGIYLDPHDARNKREVEERKKTRFRQTTPPFKPRSAPRKVATVNDIKLPEKRSLPGTILAVREVSFNKSIDSIVVGNKAKPSDQPIIISDEDEYYSNEEDGEGNNRDSKTPPKRKSFWTGKRTGTMTKEEIEYQLNLSPTPPPLAPKTPERTASGDEWDNFPVTPVTREIWPGHSGLTPELSPGWILPCAQIQREHQPIEDIYEGVEFPELTIPTDQEGKDKMIEELARDNHSLKYQVLNLMHRDAKREEQLNELWTAVNMNAEIIEAVRGGEQARRNLAVLMDNGRAPPSRQPVGELSKRGLERKDAGPPNGRKKVRKN